jgi:hypothetical protein
MKFQFRFAILKTITNSKPFKFQRLETSFVANIFHLQLFLQEIQILPPLVKYTWILDTCSLQYAPLTTFFVLEYIYNIKYDIRKVFSGQIYTCDVSCF